MATLLTIFIFCIRLWSTTSLAIGENYGKHAMWPQVTHIVVYWQDKVSRPNPTSIPVIAPVNGSNTFFGFTSMIDNKLTQKPDPNSKLVGRAQGFYASSSQQEVAFLMIMNFVFLDGEFNGSTITLIGRNPALSPQRELSIIGGTNSFQFARGSALLKTKKFDPNTGDATVEYNLSVMHF
ncbi:dirigent protein 22-like [Malania oleifera]|uniref:dirigent protein 22-like n=1 Tax=Malania oleifera TaxID=397392 RepID=UPI0025ADD61D|nr:dirigent protein 22-like [Malania oleifera]